MTRSRSFAVHTVFAIAALTAGSNALAQAGDYPNRPVKFLNAFPPGGSTDLFTRLMAQKLSEMWGQPVVVENKPGGGGNLGAQAAAKSPNDGYTVFMSSTTTHGINPSLYRNPGYDHIRDFTPVVKVATGVNVLVVNPQVPAKTVQELLAYVRANPGKLAYGSPGSGTSPHLSMELFKSVTGSDILHVPYKGSAPLLNDLLGGQVQLAFDNMPAALPHIKANKLRVLAVTSAKRAPQLPDVPTMIESGMKDFDVSPWWALFVPAGTPDAIVRKINADSVKVLQTAEVREKMAQSGAEATPSTKDELAALVRTETARWAKV